MKHKYYDVILAWAEGKPIQYKLSNDWINAHKHYKNNWIDYPVDDNDTPNFNISKLQWRIKPEIRKYRIALCKHDNDFYKVTIATRGAFDSVEVESYNSGFVDWLTDWIEEEVTE